MLGIETDQWLTSVIYFDDEYQTIQSIADLYPSGIEITSNDHDFMGNVIQTKVKQTIGSNVYEYNKWFDFNSYGRLQQVSQQITGDNTNNKVILAKYTYDELGNIATKAIHNEKQTESYTYDLTGRTISVTSPSFSYALDYEESPISSAIPRLDGNICAMRWGSSTTPNKAYTYTYDHVGQLQSADYKLLSNNVWNNSSNYKEGGLTYDLNGNILTVQRTNSSGAQLHNIAYTYEGYRLKTVNVNNVPSAAYAYDSNGNITSDGRRGVTINYNILNFPEQIIAGNQQVSYIYSAAGEKLATNANGSLTYYRSVMVYGNDNKLLHILTPEGTVSRTEGSAGTSYTYNYFKKDQIGSTRAVLSAVGNSLQNVQSTDYYPFGLAYSTNNLNKNKYLFSGKELQDASIGETILGLYDFGMRQYDAFIGRWISQDPKHQFFSAYIYCNNNPMNLIDQWGLEANRLDTLDGPPLGEVTIFGRYYPSVGSNMSTNDWNSIIGYSPNTDTGEWSTPFIPYVPEGGGASGGNRISSNKPSRKVDPKTIQQIRLLMEFLKKYFPNYKFADKVIFKIDPSLHPNRGAYGSVNKNEKINGKYLVRISPESLNSNLNIFLTMGHELVHVAHFITLTSTDYGSFFHDATEYGAYLWNVNILTHDDPYAPTYEYGTKCNQHYDKIKYTVPSNLKQKVRTYDEWGMPKQFPEFNK